MRATVVLLLNLNLALLIGVGQSAYLNAIPSVPRHIRQFSFGPSMFRVRRNENEVKNHIVDDCMLVTSEEGHFHYKSQTNDETVCGIYMIADPNKQVEVVISYLDVPCDVGGLLSWVDGWELNGEMFPSPHDYLGSEDDRFDEFCGTKKLKKILVSNQNAALLQYRIPMAKKGFSIRVRHITNPKPCNIMAFGENDTYTLRNYGYPVNCSVSAIFPATVKIIELNVGIVGTARRSDEFETGVISSCMKRRLSEYAQIGGTSGLDSSNLQIIDDVCGKYSRPANYQLTIKCGVTTVRLVSTGKFDNLIKVSLEKFDDEDYEGLTDVRMCSN